MSISRRQFLRGGAGVVAVGALPSIMGGSAMAGVASAAGRRSLVLLELNGGNDGLNTLIPVADPAYYAARPTLAIKPGAALMLDRQVGLHPAMSALHRLYQRGNVAVIQGVGYPGGNRSHFGSMEIWHRGDVSSQSEGGWLGRYCQQALVRGNLGQTLAACYGQNRPELFATTGQALLDIHHIDDAATAPRPAYGQNRLGGGLAEFAQLIIGNTGPKLFHISQGGFDTHARQAEGHAALLGTVSASLGAFMADLRAAGRDKDVLVLVFSEFGRRVNENSSAGTDHGAASVMFCVGGSVKGGLHGRYPSLTNLTDGDLKHTVDFRDIYATVTEKWLGGSADTVVAGHAERVMVV